jgi:GNAT superfamily N-acetyltransferase
MIVRDAVPGDWQRLAAGNIALAHESEGKELAPDVIENGVRAVLHDPAKGRYFIAEVDGETAGQTMVTLEWSDWRHGWFWWIQSVYVWPQFRRRGVFRSLYAHIREQAKQAGDVRGLRLYVERENKTAIATYFSLGMRDAGYLLLEEDWSGPSH